MSTNPNFQVRREDFSKTRFEDAGSKPLAAHQLRLRVDRFALTSNNISYAAAGDLLDYWSFFPAADGWGRIPVMGFGDVIESEHPQVAVGDRVFGFFPMAAELVIDVDGVTDGQFVDGAPHRRNHAAVYRQYSRVALDPLYEASREAQILLMRGLFMTSFLVDAFLEDRGDFDAETFVLGSASSKTGIALAHQLAQRRAGRVVGVTGEGNRDFVASLGYYDDVIGYEEAASLRVENPHVFIDFSGRGDFVSALHHHLGESLRHHCFVGATHWDAAPAEAGLPGPEPAFFFAPGEIAARVTAWGADTFRQRMQEGWQRFCNDSDAWLEVRFHEGEAALEEIYAEVLAGRARPAEGHILSL